MIDYIWDLWLSYFFFYVGQCNIAGISGVYLWERQKKHVLKEISFQFIAMTSLQICYKIKELKKKYKKMHDNMKRSCVGVIKAVNRLPAG